LNSLHNKQLLRDCYNITVFTLRYVFWCTHVDWIRSTFYPLTRFPLHPPYPYYVPWSLSPRCPLRSRDVNVLQNSPTVLNISKRAVCQASPAMWNSLPQTVFYSDLTVTSGLICSLRSCLKKLKR